MRNEFNSIRNGAQRSGRRGRRFESSPPDHLKAAENLEKDGFEAQNPAHEQSANFDYLPGICREHGKNTRQNPGRETRGRHTLPALALAAFLVGCGDDEPIMPVFSVSNCHWTRAEMTGHNAANFYECTVIFPSRAIRRCEAIVIDGESALITCPTPNPNQGDTHG